MAWQAPQCRRPHRRRGEGALRTLLQDGPPASWMHTPPPLPSTSLQSLHEMGCPVDGLRFDRSLVIRGLIMDTELGNLVKADRFGWVGGWLSEWQGLSWEVVGLCVWMWSGEALVKADALGARVVGRERGLDSGSRLRPRA